MADFIPTREVAVAIEHLRAHELAAIAHLPVRARFAFRFWPREDLYQLIWWEDALDGVVYSAALPRGSLERSRHRWPMLRDFAREHRQKFTAAVEAYRKPRVAPVSREEDFARGDV